MPEGKVEGAPEKELDAAGVERVLERVPDEQQSLISELRHKGLTGGDFAEVFEKINSAQIELEDDPRMPGTVRYFGVLNMPRRSVILRVSEEGRLSVSDV